MRIDEREHDEKTLDRLREIVRGYPGNCELQLVLLLADGSKVYCKCEGLRVELNDEMRRRIEELVGRDNFKTFAAPPAARPSSNGRSNGYSRSPALARA